MSEDYSRFFRDPDAGDGVLGPPFAGPAITNIRHALVFLGAKIARKGPYDQELVEAVLQFQRERGHTTHDGHCGPGTRRLLAQALLEHGEGVFRRLMVDPDDPPPLPVPFPAYRGDQPYLFASYAHKDSYLVFPEIARLHAQGHRIWYDEGIDPGAWWEQVIARALQQSAAFLVFMTPRSVLSSFVLREIETARQVEGRLFVAVHLRPSPLTPRHQAAMDELQALHAYRMEAERYQDLLTTALTGAGV